MPGVYTKARADRPILNGAAVVSGTDPLAVSGSINVSRAQNGQWTDMIGQEIKLDNKFNEFDLFAPQRMVIGSSGDLSIAASGNAGANVVYSPSGSFSHGIGSLSWSYVGSGTLNGNLQILDGTTPIFNIGITQLGPGFMPINPPKVGSPGNSMTVALAAGGPGISGSVSVLGHWVI